MFWVVGLLFLNLVGLFGIVVIFDIGQYVLVLLGILEFVVNDLLLIRFLIGFIKVNFICFGVVLLMYIFFFKMYCFLVVLVLNSQW